MNWYRSLTIRGQLYFALATMIIGFIAIGITYALSIVVGQNALAEAEKLASFGLSVEKAQFSVVEAQRIEKQFELTRDTKFLGEHAKAMSSLTAGLEQLKNNAPDEKEQSLISSVNKSLQAYRRTFYNQKEGLSIVGLDADSGLLGSLNESARKMEKQLAGSEQPALVISFFKMRQFEKNYLLEANASNVSKLLRQEKLFKALVVRSSLSSSKKSKINVSMKNYEQDIKEMVAATKSSIENTLSLTESTRAMEKEFNEMITHTKELIIENDLKSVQAIFIMESIFVLVLVLAALSVGVVFVLLMRKISSLLATLMGTITRLAAGDYDARTGLQSQDELGQLGRSLDTMLDDRLAGLAKAEKENDQLNDSIIELIEAVSTLGERDLTVSVPVAEDVTGAVADSINQMARQTAAVLNNIKTMAMQVETTSQQVKNQGDKLTIVAENERKIVENTLTSLDKAAKSMNAISSMAQNCNKIADKASQSTELALDAVNNTVSGMADIREVISETEKRIKRLGERSQEINGIVDMINTLAERTHVLALNASMQAAAAGEAGRGFAVVADEVQRLAEGSRSSTAQISELVNSIQSETSETMATMNKAITQVVDGSELAEQAGKQMVDTKQTTHELVAAVVDISKHSINQAKISDDIRERASLIRTSTQETAEELDVQAEHAKSLANYADSMLASVQGFKLPEVG